MNIQELMGQSFDTTELTDMQTWYSQIIEYNALTNKVKHSLSMRKLW